MTAPARAFVIGEALIDVIVRPGGTDEVPGGSPANVARGLARLGVPTALLTSIGDDDRGRLLLAHLTGAGVDVLPASVHHGRTATATATVDAAGDASYVFDIDWDIDPAAVPDRATLVHTGSIAAFLEPGAGKVRALLRDLRGQATLTFDPNVRPAILGTDPAPARAIFEAVASLVDVVKLSAEDAQWLYPGRTPDAVAEHITGAGPRLVAVTRGAAGSTLHAPGHTVRIAAAAADVVDTVGAGDSYMTGLILGLLETPPAALHRLGALAAAAAAYTVSHRGAELPRHRDLETTLRKRAD
ncbi:PfkB family carbohydrate kinase [Dactylosporangium sp. CA-233914]|uniref:PfkB family carbohydrate kinase n=1 Tax=Dactylosporangium sp. CA-233914 TaxID=3239934 RepID=UPI003D92D0D4